MYYTYMLRCADNSIYTGMTNNLENRLHEHLYKDKNGAKYTKSHDVIKLETAFKSKDMAKDKAGAKYTKSPEVLGMEAAWQTKEKSLACKLEYQIKTLTKQQKEDLIKGEKLSAYFKGKLDSRRYKRIME